MVPSEGAEKVRQWFDNFTGGFFCSDEGINREIRERIRHSQAVAENIREISNGALQKDTILSLPLLETAALLHDVGRFPQMAFPEDSPGDHAEYGIRLLKEKNVLKEFSDREKELVYRSIYFHNKKGAHLNCGDEEVIQLTGLLRSADKMDKVEGDGSKPFAISG